MKSNAMKLVCQIIRMISSIIAMIGLCFSLMFVNQMNHPFFLHGIVLATIGISVSSATLSKCCKRKSDDNDTKQTEENQQECASDIELKIKCSNCQRLININSKCCKYCGEKQ